MPDGELTSLDNRRLFAAKLAAETNPDILIPAEVHNWNELVRSYSLVDCLVPGVGGEDAATADDIDELLKKLTRSIPGYERTGTKAVSYADRVFTRMFCKNFRAVLFDEKKHVCGYIENPRVSPLFQTDRHYTHVHRLSSRQMEIRLSKIERRISDATSQSEKQMSRNAMRRHRKKMNGCMHAGVALVPAVAAAAGPAERTPVVPSVVVPPPLLAANPKGGAFRPFVKKSVANKLPD